MHREDKKVKAEAGSASLELLKNSSGLSLIEVMVMIGIMSITMIAMVSLQQSQMKSNSFLEFQLKRTQLQHSLLGQFLNDPANCACLFAGASPFPASPAFPGATLAGVTPTEIGRYNFITPGVCGTATIPQPLVNDIGIDGLRTTSIQLTKIMNISGAYSGEFVVNLQSTKSTLGPQDLPVRIPVNVNTTAAGANVNFVSCSSYAAASVTQPPLKINCLWTVDAGFGNCTPSPCPAGFTDSGLVYSEVSSTNNGWNQGQSVRSCLSNPSGNILTVKCPWTADGAFGNCTPPPCPLSYSQVGQTKEVTSSTSSWNVGNDIRYCRN